MVWIIIAIVIVLIAALLVYVASRPDTFEFSRSIAIAAPPERIYPLVNDLRAMDGWNPFIKPDPNIKLTYSTPSDGAGATNDFEGNNKVGSGRIMIVDAQKPTMVVMSLRMDRPMKAQNRIEFRLVPQDAGTHLTWTMSGAHPFIAKLMCTFISMDKMIGKTFETGLSDLKTLAEA